MKTKIKYCLSFRPIKTSDSSLRYVGMENVESETGRFVFDAEIVPDGDALLFQEGDILYGKLRPYLRKTVIATFNGKCSSEFLTLRAKEGSDLLYFKYLLLSERITRLINSSTEGVKMPRSSWEQLGNLWIKLPCLEEQQRISKDIDSVFQKGVDLLSNMRGQIAILENYKKTLISESLLQKNDSSIARKSTSLPAIPTIPEDSVIMPLKFIFEETGSGTTPDSADESLYGDDIPWIQSGDLYQKTEITETEISITSHTLRTVPALRLFKHDFIVIAMYGASIGNAAISKIDACTNQACCVLTKIRQGFDERFLFYSILNQKQNWVDVAVGGTQPNISQQIIRDTRIVVPPLETQKKIASFLDCECCKIDALIEIKKKKIDVLSEYLDSYVDEKLFPKED